MKCYGKSSKPDTKGRILIHLYKVPGIGKFIEVNGSIMVTRDWGEWEERMGSSPLMSIEFLFGRMGRVLEIVILVAQYCECT